MFAYGDVRAMFLGLKFHLKTIFWGSKICSMNFPIFGDIKFQQLLFLLDFKSVVPQKQSLTIKFMTKTQLFPIFLGRRYARSQYFWVQNFQGIHVFGFEFYPPYAHPRI